MGKGPSRSMVRRSTVMLAVFAVALLLWLAGMLAKYQIVNYNYYQAKAISQQTMDTTLSANREPFSAEIILRWQFPPRLKPFIWRPTRLIKQIRSYAAKLPKAWRIFWAWTRKRSIIKRRKRIIMSW